MGKSLLLFLSLSVFPYLGHCQAAAENAAINQCANKHYQDSLVAKYLDNGAHRFSYLHPNWALYCDSLIAACPNIAVAYQQKAMPLIKDGLYQQAFALINKAVALDPNRYLAYRGFLKCIFSKDYEGAITDFQQVARLKPNGREMDHTYPFFEGLCHLKLGQYKKAEASFNQDMQQQRGPDGQRDVHFNTLFYVGLLFTETRKYEQAKSYLEQCLKAYPQHPEANYYLAQVCRAQGDDVAAKKYLTAAQHALLSGYRLNEDNMFYANYPNQITEYEVTQALRQSGRADALESLAH